MDHKGPCFITRGIFCMGVLQVLTPRFLGVLARGSFRRAHALNSLLPVQRWAEIIALPIASYVTVKARSAASTMSKVDSFSIWTRQLLM